jgi:uncharacterized protein
MVMTNKLRIDRLDWDAWNLEHIRKHGVTRDEVEVAVGARLLINPTYKERFVIIGSTLAGRVLSVVVGEVPGTPHAYYVFSARPASRRERRELEQEHES